MQPAKLTIHKKAHDQEGDRHSNQERRVPTFGGVYVTVKTRFADCLILFYADFRFAFLYDDAEKAAEVLGRRIESWGKRGNTTFQKRAILSLPLKGFQDTVNILCAKGLKIVTFATLLTNDNCAEALPDRVYTAGTAMDKPSVSVTTIKRIGYGDDASFAFTLLNRMSASYKALFRFGLLKGLSELRTFLAQVQPQEMIIEKVSQIQIFLFNQKLIVLGLSSRRHHIRYCYKRFICFHHNRPSQQPCAHLVEDFWS